MSAVDLVFGWRSAVFAVAIGEWLLLAAALVRPMANRRANRALAALLVVLAGILMPFAIGFAGFYDRWPWLSFAPFAVSLAMAPLLWLYTVALVTGRYPPRLSLHLLPGAAQFAYQACVFPLPLPIKNRIDAAATPWVDPIVGIGVLAGLAGYGLASAALLRRYRHFLADRHSDEHRYAPRWIARTIAAMLVLFALRTGYEIADRIVPLTYFTMIGLYLGIAVTGTYLGIEGWRHATLPFPPLAADPPVAAEPQDWRARGEEWAARTRAGGWAADPELTLARLAQQLGTNTSYLSRALNIGLGVNFSTFVNGQRAEAVAALIDIGDQRDLLTLALDAGFSSKAGFNRAFRARFGDAPSVYRRDAKAKNSPRAGN